MAITVDSVRADSTGRVTTDSRHHRYSVILPNTRGRPIASTDLLNMRAAIYSDSYGTLYSVDPGTRDPGTQIGMHCACTYGSLEPRSVSTQVHARSMRGSVSL